MPKSKSLDKKTARLLDANLNRACEGLRVIEDIGRYIWNDQNIFKKARSLRHRLHVITASHYTSLVLSRDSEQDMGRRVKEKARSSVGAVLAANLRRAEEAARVLEEFSKVFSPQAAAALKRVRYELYTLEKAVIRKEK